MAHSYSECGAPLAVGACIEHVHQLLAREYEIPPVPDDVGRGAHFDAISTYVLQHPTSMGYTAEALAEARILDRPTASHAR